MITMGVDLGIRKIAYSIWEDDVLTDTEATTSHAGTRQGEIMDCADFLYDAVYHVRPDHLWIEDTLVGNNIKYSIKLAQVMGGVMLRVAELQGIRDFGAYQVNVSTWKKEVIGNGRADKEKIREYLYTRDSAYAELCGNDQDRFDAACIGYYGVLTAQKSNLLTR